MLMRKLGKKQLRVELQKPLKSIPKALAKYKLERSANGEELTYTYDSSAERTGITSLLTDLTGAGLRFKDIQTSQSSLEDIFVSLVKASR